MRRSPRVLLAWAAALIVMLVTVRIVTGDLGSLHRRAHNFGRDVTVVLATRDLTLGTTLVANDLRVVQRPSTTVTVDALHDARGAIGRVVSVALLRDEAVSARHLVVDANGVVPVGHRAVHVVVKDGFAPPSGSVVDVLATFDPASGPGSTAKPEAQVVADGAVVMTLAGPARMDDPTAGSAGSAGASDTDSTGAGVTILVTESEAGAVAYAASVGVVSLALAPARSACCSAPTP